jgi:hypothetical protein
MSKMPSQENFLVVGAGPLGLAMAKALGEAGVPYVQVEATDHVGGNWAHGVYETAHIISSRKTTEFPDYPMPASYPDFPSAQQMCAYYEDFAEVHALRGRIRFECPLERCEPLDGRWSCTFGDGTVEQFKGVYVCNGHHWRRHFPAWVERFEGEVRHSKDYERPDDLRGKRVLVLGGGNSGCDLASEAARVAARTDWSLRRGYWIMPKSVLGRPIIELLSPWTPVSLQRLLVKAVVRLVIGRYSDYGLPEPDHRPFERHPTVNSEVFHYLAHGRIRPRPSVAGVNGRVVTFADGSSAEYDTVVCGTGFEVSFPFLPEGLVKVRGKVAELIGGALVPGQRHLYIVGAYQPRYGIGPVVRPYCQMLAHWAHLQEELEVPLADVLVALGQKAPTSEVLDPHKAIRGVRMARFADPLIRWKGRRMARVS